MDRYEEALERAKKGLPIDEVFPELKESEDERIRKELIGYLTHRAEVTGFIDEDKDCKRWIAYLEQQKEQKPAEWSEEDTEMYINVASSLQGYACGLENEEHKRHIKKELDWLENRFQSLRPSWKPSEEQMEALMLAIEGKWDAIKPTGYMSRRLEDLYEGLANTFGVECNLEK